MANFPIGAISDPVLRRAILLLQDENRSLRSKVSGGASSIIGSSNVVGFFESVRPPDPPIGVVALWVHRGLMPNRFYMWGQGVANWDWWEVGSAR